MVQKLMNTQNEYSLALARLLLGLVFFAHGAQKMLGWFGRGWFLGHHQRLRQIWNAHRRSAIRDLCRAFWELELVARGIFVWLRSPSS